MPPDMAISMRHTKLKAEEAALLAGEINKPTWESRNEGIHERVSFEDSIWGFDLAGGIFYKTPLRVTFVKPDSRAEKAGIRPGDKLLRINDLDTSTLTIQQAHDIIIESGIHLKLSVTAPEDEEDSYYCYEDPLIDGYDSEEERRIEEEKAAKRRVCARVSHYWSLQWPWVSKRRFIYRESNCFMVPSKYEDARRDKYPPLPSLRYTDDIVHFSKDKDNTEGQDSKKPIPSLWEVKQNARKDRQERLARAAAEAAAAEAAAAMGNGTGEIEQPVSETTQEEKVVKEVRQKSNRSRRSTLKVERQETIDESAEKEEETKNEQEINEEMNEIVNDEEKEEMNEVVNDEEKEEMNADQDEEMKEVVDDEKVEEINNDITENNNDIEEPDAKLEDENNNDEPKDILIPVPELNKENNEAVDGVEIENNAVESEEVENKAIDGEENTVDDNVEVNGAVNDDDVLNEVLGKTSDSASRSEEDNNILDSILSDDGQNLENSESNNER
ncbi:hypothetical protein PYW07_017447 [Mythimna separata]|uniref:PDZ domain-containing protein n=1 Tax=Mythimna separata TaxID=271217 RepID=A0AAD7YXS9_MYTSE|nr:hypothetical protein PYW07_017447 [Mythimna separata]